VAYRRPSNGRKLLSDLCSSRNISTNYFISFIHAGGWRLKDCGFDKYSLRSRGDIRGRSYIPEFGFISWTFWIDSMWVSFSSVTLSNCSYVSNSFSSSS
jgi:hypothetical protein